MAEIIVVCAKVRRTRSHVQNVSEGHGVEERECEAERGREAASRRNRGQIIKHTSTSLKAVINAKILISF